jgi:sulfur-oxidizing protein SoxY
MITLLRAALLLTLLLPQTGSANEKAEPDPAQSPYWAQTRELLFGSRELLDGRDVIGVYLNTRADDSSTVPVAVKARFDQSPQRYIRTIWLVVERNPSPTAGVFHFTPDSGRAQVETRLRFEDFSHVRAIAETNDGRLYMGARWVKAAGGCSAPGDRNQVPPELLGRMKLRFDDEIRYHEPNLVHLLIRHPQESAMAADFDGSRVPRFVRSVAVYYNDVPVMTAQVDFSLSENPSFRFFFVPEGPGQLRVEVEDTHDQHYTRVLPIEQGILPPGG